MDDMQYHIAETVDFQPGYKGKKEVKSPVKEEEKTQANTGWGNAKKKNELE